MNAEILAVGTELLLGDIVNTNAQYIARRLADLGIGLYHQSVVGDNPERLMDAFKLALNRADMVITTGGLGPTKDDLTKETVARYFNKELVIHRESLKKIEEYFDHIKKTMADNNKKQAYFPEDSIILPNNHGTAPGCIVGDNKKAIILLPGPPKEMVPMFEESVVPYLSKFQDGVFASRVLRILGMGESTVADAVKDIMDSQTNPTVAPYVKEGEVTLRITARAKNHEEAFRLMEPMENKIRQILGDNIYGVDDTDIESVVGELLLKNNLTISTAESCTGGLLSGRLVNFPGISSVFMNGAVTYSNEAKMRMLGVKKETLDKFGAVSPETASEMAMGIALNSNTDIGLSTTGIAGPGGGTVDKPVGLVYVGLYFDGDLKTIKLNLSGDRQNIRNRTVLYALNLLRREIKRHEI